ncbi:MAG TPA: TRAP transporter small permease subunit [Burkholderiales bacterium]|jgi:TRAP-type mannitol/chloroaromatic compound transport system permease small subunit|nr:TRAP transporter small permease subunit [Burkholderiales bacterium]
MPTVNFILPHWMYWGGLFFFPLAAMFLVRHQQKRGTPREPILFNAYLFWITAGFAGVHRFYLKSWWGLVFIPLFLGIIYCNRQVREVHEDVSKTYSVLEQSKTELDRAKPDRPESAPPEQRKRYEQAQSGYAAAQKEFDAAQAVSDTWYGRARALGILIALLLLADAILIPRIVRRLHATGQAGVAAVAATTPHMPPPPDIPAIGTAQDPTMHLHTRFTDVIEWVNVKAGQYVAYWGVIAVFVYYYEVVARFVFNSPTNWVHESMFLMFGMQYMISGAYAYKEDQHVRVDVLYTHLSVRGKAIADIVSSVFFFIFTVTMLYTGWKFAWDAVQNGETSFTEWTVQYWPVKLAIPLGAALIVLQGISKLLKDIMLVARRGA